MDRLDAAHALLGVSPASTTDGASSPAPLTEQGSTPFSADKSRAESWDANLNRINSDKSRDSAEALSALAALASSAATLEPSSKPFHASQMFSSMTSSSSDDDSEAMPPPPPRRGRMRSASNPEGMEKWDSLMRMNRSDRKLFVLPSSIIEEELASANAAINSNAEAAKAGGLPFKKRVTMANQQQGIFSPDTLGTSPDSVAAAMVIDSGEQEQGDKSPSGVVSEDNVSPQDETDVEPEELLRRARARLLEDLSEGSINGDKGVLPLPHSLEKYKEIYNRNGRIGVYTPAERAAIIAKFNGKRSRRVWNKKIRYNCRKNLADRRMRVKGRFVKRSTEQAAAVKAVKKDEVVTDESGSPTTGTPTQSRPMTPPKGPLTPVMEAEDDSESADDHMPDVTDAEAGFAPTADQPYRRTRRHTIT